MKREDLKRIIAEELNKLREAMPLPLDDEEEDRFSPEQREQDRRLENPDLYYGDAEEGLPTPITVEVRGGPVLVWNTPPEVDVLVATLDAQRQIFGEDALTFVGPNAEEAEEIYMGISGAGSVNEVTDDQLNKPFMKTLGITKKDGKYVQDGEEKTADYIQKLYDRREKASQKRSGKGRS
tara:strand:+ start:4100 stop:4639 length:540 start_codon:yes stop_codon:yes gene_type:complete